MGLFDPSLAGDATGGFLSRLAQRNRTPADTVAQRFPASEPGWLGPASLLGIGTSLPLFPPLQPDAAPQWSPPPGGDFAPATDSSVDQSALPLASSGATTGPWTAFQQNDVPSVAPGVTTGPWTAFQQQPSASAAASSGTLPQQADAVVASPAKRNPLIDEGGKSWVSQAGVFAPQPSDQQLADRLSAYLADNPTAPRPSLFDRVAERFNNPPNGPSLVGLAGQFWSGITAPGDVWTGKLDPMSDEGAARAAALAAILTGGGTAFTERGAIGTAGGRLTGGGSKLPMDVASRMARAKDMGYSEQPFFRGEAQGTAPTEYPGGAHFSRDKDYAEAFAQRGGQSEPREFRLDLRRTFSDADALTAEQYARLVRAADPKLAADLVDIVAAGKGPAWFQEFARQRPDFAVTGAGGGAFVRHFIFKNSSAPERLFKRAGYDALDSGRDVRKLTGEGVRLESAKFDPAKRRSINISASLAAGAVMAPALLDQADPRSD